MTFALPLSYSPIYLVELTGLEPATECLRRSIPDLRHHQKQVVGIQSVREMSLLWDLQWFTASRI